MQQHLIKAIRKDKGKGEQPTVGIAGAQSVKSALTGSRENTGYDGGKVIKGIKRQIITDTPGLLLCVVVTAASAADRKGGATVAGKLKPVWTNIGKIFADGGYSLTGKAD